MSGFGWLGNIFPVDRLEGTTLKSQTPVLCSRCHCSLALDLDGSGPTGDQVGPPTFSSAMHAYHGNVVDWNGNPAFPSGASVDETCYRCHPGTVTACQRGVLSLPRGHFL